jgi:hypothetical protein
VREMRHKNPPGHAWWEVNLLVPEMSAEMTLNQPRRTFGVR